ncbi:MAG TPA: dihydrofolate reductase family protein [Candidatus Acidoferrales bacterium]
MDPIHTLTAPQSSSRVPVLPDDLRHIYNGDLSFPIAPAGRPYLFANFVSTLDGVVSFNIPGQSEGKQISGSNQADTFIMGLLRAFSDAVVVGATTFKVAGHDTLWFPESVYPPAAGLYRRYRNEVLKKSEYPLLVIISRSGRVDLTSAAFHTKGQRALIITSEQGKQNLRTSPNAPASLQVRALSGAQGRSEPSAILSLLREEFDVKFALNEGGPNLFGQFLVAGLVDELFLTLAPQIAGRVPQHPRPAFVDGVEFLPGSAPLWSLLSAKQAADHLYLHSVLSKLAGVEA